MIHALFANHTRILLVDPGAPPQELEPNDDADPPERISVGGEANRWLNITGTITAQGARDPDRAIYMCNVCENNETSLDNCSSANYTQLTIGTPPLVEDTSGKQAIVYKDCLPKPCSSAKDFFVHEISSHTRGTFI